MVTTVEDVRKLPIGRLSAGHRPIFQGIEPESEAEQLLFERIAPHIEREGYHCLNDTGDSIDLIIMGQEYHWFMRDVTWKRLVEYVQHRFPDYAPIFTERVK